MPKLTKEQRALMARNITEVMRAHYEQHGETGDWADGERYLRDDASDEELIEEHKKWVPHSKVEG